MKFSIIVPVYNTEKYIDECIESIIEQSYSNFELIIVNDGSTDRSLDKIENWSKIDDRIIIINQKNNGVSAARNAGLKIANGEWIAFIDSDDYVCKDYLRILYSVIEKEKADGVAYSLSNNNVKVSINILNKSNAINACISNKMLGGYPWNKLFKKEIIRQYNLRFEEDIDICEDLLFSISYFSKIERIAYYICDKNKLYNYRIYEESSIHTKDVNKILSALKVYDSILTINELSNSNKKDIRKIYANICWNCFQIEKNNKLESCETRQLLEKKLIKNYKYLGIKNRIKFWCIILSDKLKTKLINS